MTLKHYPYFTNHDFKDYEFYSEGPRGRIKKVVRFTKVVEGEPCVYNLALGDLSADGMVINDSIVSNNGDRDMILATIANIIVVFTEHYGDHFVFAEGSSASRTRLYQMSISRLWNEIESQFVVLGMKNNEWEEFQLNVNYEAFIVRRKYISYL